MPRKPRDPVDIARAALAATPPPGRGGASHLSLTARALLHGIRELAEAKGVKKFRVDHKRNARGEMVIALIIDDGGVMGD